MQLLKHIRSILPQGYTAEFVAGEQNTDDEIQIFKNGVDTDISVQVGEHYLSVNVWDNAKGELKAGPIRSRVSMRAVGRDVLAAIK